ncbi:MAG TPA: sulfatase [Geminicoccaceae bacterium]|nr:sulfatase [Geminicoccus sp.]HMU51503.1 sulfatase [Geminicoccaceae bacterium]
MNDKWLSASAVGLLAAMAAVVPGVAPALAEAAERPNIVLVLTDDEDFKTHSFLPSVKSLLADKGAVFDNYFTTYSFCCPSRATALRGQYAHNHRIVGNDVPSGGFDKFRELGHEASTVATWLQDAGYHTAILGKYLNHYEPETDAPAPGWDEWYVPGSENYAYFNYWLNENGTPVHYGSEPGDYLTDVIARRTLSIIERQAAGDRPFFLYVAPYAPHSPATPAPRHAGLFADQPYPRTPAFDEADVGDKPSAVRDLPRLAEWELEAIDRHGRERAQSIQSVDEMVRQIVEALERTGELDNTYIVYASDNGFHQGEHRMFFGKTTAYEEDIRVPMILRGPGVPEGVRIKPFVLNNDLAPTFAAMAGVTPPSFVDGRNFLPAVEDQTRPWRQAFMTERRQGERHELTGTAKFDALRTAEWTYVEYGNGERELYDLIRDPYQVQNQIQNADPAMVAGLSQRLAELSNCAGSGCREFEDRPMLPAHVPVAEAKPAAKPTTVPSLAEMPRLPLSTKAITQAVEKAADRSPAQAVVPAVANP